MEPSSLTNLDSDRMESELSPFADEQPSANPILWDWRDLLDFTIPYDEDYSGDHAQFPSYPPPSELDVSAEPVANIAPERVRKRDPRLSCFNFLAGRVPCACPEMDAMAEEEEDAPQKKRVRASRAGWTVMRCQVPDCEADISQLKGYHKRHRVCLNCATAWSVVVDGESKRYCQQCGKFHELAGFDEGRRSCRRKLERHNNRRRRKPNELKVAVEKEANNDIRNVEGACDGENETENLSFSQASSIEKESYVKPEDGKDAAVPTGTDVENINSDCGTSFVASQDNHINPPKQDFKFSASPSFDEENATYSSQFPTGRISFKLYDWNPAEFPRRLRHQIFQWLASMPVELEGYIRPGCTILTAFISMPRSRWVKLLDEPLSHIHDLCVAPGRILSGKGPMLIYVNNLIYQIMKDGHSLVKIDVKKQSPRLHCVYPACFEAGRPIEFFACGSNLLQHKFRFLVSFEGRYLEHDSCIVMPCERAEFSSDEHQSYRICIPPTEPHRFGPAFIEVENRSGLSNFYPVLIGDRNICREVKAIQKKIHQRGISNSSISCPCSSGEAASSDFVMDVAWLLKKPSPETLEQVASSSNIRRIASLFSFLRRHGSTSIIDRIIRNLEVAMDQNSFGSANCFSESFELQTLRNLIKTARDDSEIPCSNQGQNETSSKDPLIQRETKAGTNHANPRLRKSQYRSRPMKLLTSRLTILAVAVVAACCVVCAAVLHPKEVSQLAVSAHRCLTARFRR